MYTLKFSFSIFVLDIHCFMFLGLSFLLYFQKSLLNLLSVMQLVVQAPLRYKKF